MDYNTLIEGLKIPQNEAILKLQNIQSCKEAWTLLYMLLKIDVNINYLYS